MDRSAEITPGGTGGVPPRLAASRPVAGRLGLIAGVLFLVLGAALFWFNPAEHAFYPRCLFHQWTGLQCPGCGGLRSLHQLLHGHFVAALHHNALAVLALPLAGGLAGREWFRRRRGAGSRHFVGTGWFWGGLVALLLFALLRNLPVFAFLSP